MHMLKLLTATAFLFGTAGTTLAQGSYDTDTSTGTEMSDDAMATGAGSVAMTGKIGEDVFLMDANKMTLYTFDNDSAGMSACYDSCAQNWPPLVAPAGTDLPRGYSLIEREDGTMQVAYQDQPLYLWVNDTRPGEMTGDGVGGVWHIARP
jgi:predicted lipoprotein with Yx(FWY)xxD motif